MMITGAVLTALLTAVLSNKLIFTRCEKYVHIFATNVELSRAQTDAAANVVKYAFYRWHLKKKSKTQSIKFIKTERTLLFWILRSKAIRNKQRQLIDSHLGFAEISKNQRENEAITEDAVEDVRSMQRTVKRLEKQMLTFNQSMASLQKCMNILIKKMDK